MSLPSPALRVPLLLMPMPVTGLLGLVPPVLGLPVPVILSFPENVLITPGFKILIPIATDAFDSSATKVSIPEVPIKLGGTVSLGIDKILSMRIITLSF